jgi:hypothetical protein
MKLGYLHRDEGFRIRNKSLFKEAEVYFSKVVDILENNLISKPTTIDEKHHNAIDYNMLANAYLMMGANDENNNRYYDLNALRYLILGLKLERDRYQLKYTLGHPGIKKILQRFNLTFYQADDKIVTTVINLENSIYKELDKVRLTKSS